MFKKKLALATLPLALAVTQGQAFPDPHWGYTNETGPTRWGGLDPTYAMCAKGVNQSPIDVGNTVHADLAPVAIDYAGQGIEILNNGHTVQVNAQAGGTLTMDGRTFTLKQFHFHAPSEHTVAGKSYALEAHFVHADPEGHLAVIGVLLSEGEPNADLAKLWAAMPTEVGAAKPLTIPVNPASLLPANRDYFRYNGSLTTPPCTEGVRWLVMKEPLSVSKEQVFELIQVLHGFKNRPVQPVNARPVLR